MVLWESRFKGEYISAAELGDRRPTLTIVRISTCKMEDEKKKRDVDKPVMWFKETDRGWLYCKTVGHCLAAMFGDNDDAWIGKQITMYADPEVRHQSEQVGGIRIAGSPNIPKPLVVRIKFPKKKAFEVHLVPTGKSESEKRVESDTSAPPKPQP